MKYLSSSESAQLDAELFNFFSVDQLMELAGLACAHAIVHHYKHVREKRVLVCCGPGNNGGDGLVCARHLKLHDFNPSVFYPKRPNRPLFNNLVEQCHKFDIGFVDKLDGPEDIGKFELVVDAVFGFSFVPPIRAPFDELIRNINDSHVEVASIDVPSGLDVDNEDDNDNNNLFLKPNVLISLTAPKKCARNFRGNAHYLGGRFVPEQILKKYQLDLPRYEDLATFVRL